MLKNFTKKIILRHQITVRYQDRTIKKQPLLKTTHADVNSYHTIAHLTTPIISYFCINTHKPNQLTTPGYKNFIQQLLKKQGQLKANSTNPKLLKQLISTANRQVFTLQQSIKIQQFIKKVLTQFMTITKQHSIDDMHNKQFIYQLFYLVQAVCLNNFNKIISRSKSQKQILTILKDKPFIKKIIAIFSKFSYAQKQKIVKFVTRYHSEDKQINKVLIQHIKQNNTQFNNNIKYLVAYIRYIRTLIKYVEVNQDNKNIDNVLNYQFLQQGLKYVYNYIMLNDPNSLYLLTDICYSLVNRNKQQYKQLIKANIILHAVMEHVKGLKLIQSSNMADAVYLIKVLQIIIILPQDISKVSPQKIRTQAVQIYNFIKNIYKNQQPIELDQQNQEQEINQHFLKQEKQKDQTQNKVTNKQIRKGQQLRLIDINILMQSMLRISVIDASLFGVLQNLFFKLVDKSDMVDMCMYIKARIKVTRAVIQNLRSQQKQITQQKVRCIKQEHKKFITKLIPILNNNNSLTVNQKLNVIQNCQILPVKSRQIKKIINQMIAVEGQNRQLVAYAELIKDTF